MSEAILRYRDRSGTERSVRLPAGPVVSVGSDPRNRVVLTGADIRPVHFQLWHEKSGWAFQTPSGAASVLVNGEKRNQGRLKPGDTIQVGPFALIFEAGQPGTRSPYDVDIDESSTLAALLPGDEAKPRKPKPVDFAELESEPGAGLPSSTGGLKGLVAEPQAESPSSGALTFEEDAPIALEPVTQGMEKAGEGRLELLEPPTDQTLPEKLSFEEETLDEPFTPAGSAAPNPPDDVNTSRIRFVESVQDKDADTVQTGWEYKEAARRPSRPAPKQATADPTETAKETPVRLVSDKAKGDDFVSLGEPATASHDRPRQRVFQRQRREERQNPAAVITISVLMLALLGSLGYVLFSKPPAKPEESPLFADMLEAFVKQRDDELRELEKQFWDRPATETQKARVKEMLAVVEVRELASSGSHDAAIRKGQAYLASAPHYAFMVVPLVQSSFLQLARKRKEEGDVEAAEGCLERAIGLSAETDAAREARAQMRAWEEERRAQETAAAAKKTFEEFMKEAPGLLSQSAFQRVIERFEEVVKVYPAAAESEECRSYLEQAAKGLEKAEVREILLTTVAGEESKRLLVQPEPVELMRALAVTATLYRAEGGKTATITGEDVFERPAEGGQDSLVVEAAGACYGVNPETGKIRWVSPKGEARGTPLAVIRPPNAPAHLLGFCSSDRELHLFSSADGKELWRIRLQGRLSVAPESDGRTIWLGTEPTKEGDWPPRLLILDVLSGELLRACDLASPLSCPPLQDRVQEGEEARTVLYVCTRDSYFYVLSPEAGKSLQGMKMRGPVTQPPLKVPPYLLLFQHDKGKGVVTAAKVGPNGLADRKTWQQLEMSDRPAERPSVDAALVYVSGAKGSVFTFGVEVKRDEAPVYDASRGGQDIGLRPPVFLTATEDGRQVYAAADVLKSVEFQQFEAASRLTPRWTFEGKDGWPRPDRAAGPVEIRQDGLFLQTGRKSAPGSLQWSLDPKTGQPAWCLSLSVGLGCRPLVIAEDRALLRTCDGRLLAALWKGDGFLVEPRDYEVRRLAEFDRAASQPVVAKQDTRPLVLFGNHDGLFYAVEQDTGFSAWKTPFSAGQPVLSAAMVLGGAAYVCAGSNVYGISLQDGAKLHQFSVDERSKFLAAPVVFGDTLVVGDRNGTVHGLKPATESGVSFLREQWRYETEGPIRVAAVVSGDLVLAGSDDGRIYGLNASGALVRRWNLGAPVATDPASQGDRVFVAVRNGTVLCLSPGADEPVWTHSLPGEAVPCSLLSHAKSVFVATTQGRILQLNAADGAVVRTLQAGRTAVNGLAAMGDRLLAASADGHLYFAEGQW